MTNDPSRQLAEALAGKAQAERDRDLAIAHDRQPYPTAWAYEQVCKARTEWQARAKQAEAARDQYLAALDKAHDVARADYQQLAEALDEKRDLERILLKAERVVDMLVTDRDRAEAACAVMRPILEAFNHSQDGAEESDACDFIEASANPGQPLLDQLAEQGTRITEMLEGIDLMNAEARITAMNLGITAEFPKALSVVAALAIEVERLREDKAQHDREIVQFNDGWQAGVACEPEDGQPRYEIDEDTWRGGYRDGAWGRLRAELARLREDNAALNIALFHFENGLSHPDERVRKLIEAAEAAKKGDDRA
ncbi:MAG: hypothetical protein IMZ50_15550 [Candidatus Atribacteria bacterium]|nr:hypothetical protein [Candidatus Atribacteria bacterium]